MTDINRVLVFRSIDAKKQNSNNKPGNFTIKFIPELILEENKQNYIDTYQCMHHGTIFGPNIVTTRWIYLSELGLPISLTLSVS